MSRIGKQKIQLPANVDLTVNGRIVSVKGPKGSLTRELHESVQVENANKVITVKERTGHEIGHTSFIGLSRTLINNMVVGVSQGYQKSLTLIGVGYRAATKGDELQLTLGYSHPVIYKVPKGLTIAVDKQTVISISGADKEQVGQAAADIRAFRRPEPYHGKGVRYSDEVIITKVGKSSGKK